MSRTCLPDFSAVRGCSLLVALSGGADSVALLHMLADARESENLTLTAAHVDHCIRGEESHRDAEFCREECASLNIPLKVEVIDVPALASGEGLETAARRLRYDSLRKIRRECGADYIALAHHLDDQAETVLMHLLRGCGPEGIGGMEILSGDLYRPLLGVPKSSLEDWLTGRGISWRTDQTNLVADTPRNVLRLSGIPALKQAYPAAAGAICRYAEAARCEDRFLERLTQDFLNEHRQYGAYGVRLTSPESADEAILRRCLRRIVGDSLSHDRLLELISLCARSHGRVALPGGILAERTPNAIYFLPGAFVSPDPVPLPEIGTASLPGIGRIVLEPCQAVPIRDDPCRQVLRSGALKGSVLRTRRRGDRMRFLGAPDRLLSDILIDRKIDRPMRDTLPLVANGNRVLWAVGIGISEDAKLLTRRDNATLLRWLPIN